MEHTFVNGNSTDPSVIIFDAEASESSKRVSHNLLKKHLKFQTEIGTERTESRLAVAGAADE